MLSIARALLKEAGVEIHYLENPPFPMREFTLKAKRGKEDAVFVSRKRPKSGRPGAGNDLLVPVPGRPANIWNL